MPIPMAADLSAPQKKTADQAIDENLSMMSPQDAFVMAEKGMLRADMSVRDLFSQLGVDVDGPVSQLSEMVQRESEKANPINKMRAMADADPMMDPVEAKMGAAGGGNPSGGSLDELMMMGGR